MTGERRLSNMASPEWSPAMQKLVQAGRRRFEADLGGSGQEFDAMIWDVSSLQYRLTRTVPMRLLFTHFHTREVALPAYYAVVVKSWLLLTRGISINHLKSNLSTARLLWQAILQRRRDQPDRFRWETLCEEDLSQAELLMRERWRPVSVYQQGIRMLVFAEFLATWNLCRPLYYTLQTPNPTRYREQTLAGQEAGREKLPSPRALAGMAEIYSRLAHDPPDRLLAAAVAILVVSGLRIGELLTLPEDCEVRETRRGRPAYGLRYFKEKTRGGGKQFAVRWLTPLQAELAGQAIAEIRRLTAGPRERARIMEQNPDRVPIPGFSGNDRMTPDEVARSLGLCNRFSVYRSIRADQLTRHRDEGGHYYIAAEVETYLLSRRAPFLWTLAKGNGEYQMLSETLLIVFKNFFHSQKGTNELLVQSIDLQQLNDFMSGCGRVKSAFERFDIREEDGSFCRVTAHRFRHWLNDLADKGGLPIDVLTRWMGRENPQHTEAYRHATVEERLTWVKQGIRQEVFSGAVADVYASLPEAERDAFLEGQIQAVHFTPMGLCIHDFAIEPCPFHLNCVRGCPDYLRTRGNQRERDQLLQVKRQTERALANARRQTLKTGVDLAPTWVQHHEETLLGVERALAVDEDIAVADGALVHPPDAIPLKVADETRRQANGTQE